jgi:hypothetical protein
VHGEAETAKGFARLLHERFGWSARAPAPADTLHL